MPGTMLGCVTVRQERPASGFTIVELLVTSVIVGVVLLGVNAVFLQTINMEGRAAARQSQRDILSPVVAHLSEALECAVNLPEIAAIVGGPVGNDGDHTLTCCVGPKGDGNRSIETQGIQRRRYQWKTAASPEDFEGIKVQVLDYAGTSNIAPVAGSDTVSEDEIWNTAPARIIGRRIHALSITYRQLDQAGASWLEQWDGAAGNVAIRIRAASVGCTEERVVVPQTDGPLVPSAVEG